jgi:hypothetical protein
MSRWSTRSHSSDISTKINLDAITLLDITGDDLQMLHKKVIVNKYIEAKTNDSKRSVASIAKELGIGKSTLDRYKSDVGLTSTRRVPQYSAEKRREITAKALATRKRNQMYKAELKELMDNKDMTKEELDREFDRLRDNYARTAQNGKDASASTASTSVSGSTAGVGTRKMRGGTLAQVDENDIETVTHARRDIPQLNTTYDSEKLLANAMSSLPIAGTARN